MAKNYIQDGDSIVVTAPYDLAPGDGCLVGSHLFGVSINTSASGATDAVIATEGCWQIAKVSAEAWAIGDWIYWDNAAKKATKTQNTAASLNKIGVAMAVAANPTSTGIVRLNGAF